jgi:hypothetical protein
VAAPALIWRAVRVLDAADSGELLARREISSIAAPANKPTVASDAAFRDVMTPLMSDTKSLVSEAAYQAIHLT